MRFVVLLLAAVAAIADAQTDPDGYTLMVTTNTPQAANVSLFKKLNYDPVKDFAPIARLGTTSFMLMVRLDFPARNLREFLSNVKKQPGKLSAGYGSSGSQVSLAMLKSMGRLDVVEVPYKGIPQAVTEFGLVAPAKTPNEVVRKLHDATVRGLAKSEVKEKFAAIGTDVAPLNPAEFARFIHAEIAHWAKLVKLAGIEQE
jgi:tripartite-type tricarboxylate transporter receptor subunit TctC